MQRSLALKIRESQLMQSTKQPELLNRFPLVLMMQFVRGTHTHAYNADIHNMHRTYTEHTSSMSLLLTCATCRTLCVAEIFLGEFVSSPEEVAAAAVVGTAS